MRIFCLIAFVFLFAQTYAQDGLAAGTVTFGNAPLPGVTVRNFESGQTVMTDNKGIFKIYSRIGDIVYFYYVGMKDTNVLITTYNIGSNSLEVKMEEFSTNIDEVVVDKNGKIDAVSLGIIPYTPPQYTTNERRLKTAGDFKYVELFKIIAGGLKIDPILNAINGKTKMLKKGIVYEKNAAVVEYLRVNFHDYIKNNLKIEDEDEIVRFCYFVGDIENSAGLTRNNDLQTKFYLANAMLDYNERKTKE